MTVFLILAVTLLPTWGVIGWTIVRAGAIADRMLEDIRQIDDHVPYDASLINDELERERGEWHYAKYAADIHARPLPPLGLWPEGGDVVFDLNTLKNRMMANPVPDRTEVGRWQAFLTSMVDSLDMDERLMED